MISTVSSWDYFLDSESLSESPGLCLRLETSSSNGFRTLDLKLFKDYRLVPFAHCFIYLECSGCVRESQSNPLLYPLLPGSRIPKAFNHGVQHLAQTGYSQTFKHGLTIKNEAFLTQQT